MAEEQTETPLSATDLFNTVGPAYENAFEGHPEQAASVRWLISQLEAADIKPAKLVDIGCGTGVPVCSGLAAAGHDVLGIDISPAMIAAAKTRVPAAKFEVKDIRDFNPGSASLDAITIYFSLIASVTQDEIKGFIKNIYTWLKPGGLFVFATVPLSAESIQIKWMGHPVQVSSLAPEEAGEAIKSAGFEIMNQVVMNFTPKGAEAGICKPEDVWEEPHLFVYARKP
jgi:2-polyprenyl-3-methyl-5-hydroxy-6-metoxy-1,4-benzoquinol methylase